jgi:hypothetical protein
MYTFRPPQEILEPHLWKSTQDFSHINTGKFVRNAVLSSKIYNGSDLAPAYIKNRDAIHPLYGYKDQLGASSSVFGGCGASADADNARGILNPQNESTWWAPGGTGADSWIYAKLPEATLVETYDIGSARDYCPLSWKLQGSQDGSAWADLHVVDNSGVWDATYETKTFTIPETSRGAYLYYRLYVTSSNQSTMKIRLLRLYRAASVCAKGQLLIDASAADPLLMSFAAGFSGATPLDYEESLSAALLKTVDFTTLNLSAVTPFNINAVRNSSGGVEIELENASGEGYVQADGGMFAQNDKNWVCDSNNSNLYNRFGRVTSNSASIGLNTNSADVSFLTQRASGIFAKSFYMYARTNRWQRGPVRIYTIELDNSHQSLIVDSTYSGDTCNMTININRAIKGIFIDLLDGDLYGMKLISPSYPAYRLTNGKLYERESPVDAWTECQKIRLATCVLDPTKLEVFQPLALSALQLQWLTNGNAETYLEP